MSLLISPTPFNPETEHHAFRTLAIGAGAIVAFTGIVRPENGLDFLELTHYPGFTEQEIGKFIAQAQSKWDISHWRIVHRVGKLAPQDPIVFVATAAPHRRDAFLAADYCMDYLKSEAPFWKFEHRGGHDKRWIEPRSQDLNDKQRWET